MAQPEAFPQSTLDLFPAEQQQISAEPKNPSKLARIALAIGLGLTGGAATTMAEQAPQAAYAAVSDTYPDKDVPCANQSDPDFGNTSGSGTPWCDGYDWGKITYGPAPQNAVTSISLNSGRGYGYRNCTDWVAWRLSELGITVPKVWGKGGDWDDKAILANKIVDNTPEVGDIAVWDPSTPTGFGHVEVVEKVNTNGTVDTSGYNKAETGSYGTQSGVTAHHYIDLNGTTPTTPPAPTADKIDELAFVRESGHWTGQAEIITLHGAPGYGAIRGVGLTGYPAVSDPGNVVPLAIKTNNDAISELGFVRMNHWSGKAELVTRHGSPEYNAALSAAETGYPAVSDTANVQPIAIDVHGDGIDELAFVRTTGHWTGHAEIVTYHGSPNYQTLHSAHVLPYPNVPDPANVTVLGINVDGDAPDELAFVRTNHWSGMTEAVVYDGAPSYGTLLGAYSTGFPTTSSPEHITPLALDINGDGIDELAFINTNHVMGKAELTAYHGSPNYQTLHTNVLVNYPNLTDPQNVTPIAIDVEGGTS